MFLAKTSLTEFWNLNENLLLLGDWCTAKNSKVLKSCNYKILPYPWKDINEKHRAYNYCKNVYENLLPQVAQYLNEINGENRSERYWRIVVGEWMWRYIHIIYDRYITLLKAFAEYEDIETYVLNKNNYHYITDNQEFLSLIGPYSNKFEDLYNLQLYSQILYLLGYNFPSIDPPQNLTSYSFNNKSTKQYLKIAINKLLSFKQVLYLRYCNSPEIGYCGVLGKQKNYIEEACKSLKLNSIYLSIDFGNSKNFPIDKTARNKFNELKSTDSFEKICLGMMEYCFPTHLLEGYNHFSSKVIKNINFYPKVILSAVSWRFDTTLSFYIAESIENKTQLIGLQHGGGYGLYSLDPMFENEYQVCDKYITWGWKNNGFAKTIPLPAFEKSIQISSQKEDILMVSNSLPRYLTIFQSSPESSMLNGYFSWQEIFINNLNDSLKNIFYYRKYFHDFGWNNNISEFIKYINSDDMSISLSARMKDCRLIIIDNNQTSLLQAIALNIPTIIFWDYDIWKIRESAKVFFDDLKNVGVFHDDPYSASDFVNKNFESIENWWFQENVQGAVKKFQNSYARTSDNMIQEWSQVINSFIQS